LSDPLSKKEYDVFLSHHGADEAAVEVIALSLVNKGVRPFLDKWHLIAGRPWQEGLEGALDRSATCAVFLGREGLGYWENLEAQSALEGRVPIIPVLLPGSDPGILPRFLKLFPWVDFRSGLAKPEALAHLIAGVRGSQPAVEASETADRSLDDVSDDALRSDDELRIPEDYRQMIPTYDTVTIRPGIFPAILAKLKQDFARGALLSRNEFKNVHVQAEADLMPIRRGTDVRRFAPLNLSAVSELSWWGSPNSRSVDTLRRTVQRLGRRILVSCSSVNVAACAALKGFFLRHGVAIDVDPNDASGREQAVTIARVSNPKFDFVVCADAPMFLDRRHNVKLYAKIFEVYHEEQFLLRKDGTPTGARPKVHVYQASSAQQQYLLARAKGDCFPLPERAKEEPLLHMADFTRLSKVMGPGDMVFAWGALAQSLMRDQFLAKVAGGDFALTVSMFRHPDWSSRNKELQALLDLFVTEWNFCADRPKVAFRRVVTDQAFLDSFARGGGYKTKFIGGPR
jgi:hypothetical protein